MKVKNNKSKVNKYSKVCAVVGFYDENNEYSEIALENVVKQAVSEYVAH